MASAASTLTWLQASLFHESLQKWTYSELTVLLLGAWSTYLVLLVFYRLYLSPIARFPGPKLAAATEWYEFYNSLVKDGQWGGTVTQMHAKYGPIVRISPWELSIRDSSFYHQLYVPSSMRRTNMWARGREGNGFQDSHHLTVPHELHRQRRKPLETFFSRQNITRVERTITEKVRALDARLQALAGSDTVVHIDHAFTALTGDIIGHVACGTSPGLLDDVDFSPSWHDLMVKTILVAPLFRCFPWLNRLTQTLPPSVMESIYPRGISNMMLGKMGRDYIESVRHQVQMQNITSKRNEAETSQRVSVFHHLLSTTTIPEPEKRTSRLQAESMVILIAGTFTSAHTLSMIVYHVLSEPRIGDRLREDLREVMAGYPARYPQWMVLEKIPYLQGCIKEALRLYGLVGNLARCSPEESIQYKQWTIPKNTPVGMSIYAMHTDPSVWSEPLRFLPERWVGTYDPSMDRNFVPFTKGSRSCLGMNLALAELYLTTAILFRPDGLKLSLFDTDESDVRWVRDFVIGFPKAGSRGLRIKVN
ncbi:cytochrome P450 [Aspergillus germanicus]